MNYVIGDIHGQYRALCKLLQQIHFDKKHDTLWLCGDVVARGDDSLAVLQMCHALAKDGALRMVLGNHDLTLIACHLGVRKPKSKDKTKTLLAHQDAPMLIDWLRKQPFLLALPKANAYLAHAGVPHIWGIASAQIYAQKAHDFYSQPIDALSTMLAQMPSEIKKICNYFTRMRLSDAKGELEFEYKDSPFGDLPKGFLPWYAWGRDDDVRIYFGHWAALGGQIEVACARNLDGGAAWGRRLIAHRLEDGQDFAVAV